MYFQFYGLFFFVMKQYNCDKFTKLHQKMKKHMIDLLFQITIFQQKIRNNYAEKVPGVEQLKQNFTCVRLPIYNSSNMQQI